jgi:hypothetical protein
LITRPAITEPCPEVEGGLPKGPVIACPEPCPKLDEGLSREACWGDIQVITPINVILSEAKDPYDGIY